jgi:hypothetical protein
MMSLAFSGETVVESGAGSMSSLVQLSSKASRVADS